VSHTYTAGETAKDDVRLLISDTNTEASVDERLEDEDIERLLFLRLGTSNPTTRGGAFMNAAADAADALAAKFARKADVGADKVNFPTRAEELRATARGLRARAASGAIPFAGGISVSDKAARAADSDRPSSAFTRGMLDNPGAS
jgi:hypothetical protein